MRYLAMGILLAAMSGAALGQSATWGAFEDGDSKGVGTQGTDGAQLILKCDKPGKGEVYAVMVSPAGLVPPSQTYIIRPVEVRIDDKPPYSDNWRFFDNSAIAINQGRERSLTRLLAGVGDAKTVELRLYPDPKKRAPTVFRFEMAGTETALGHVFESCNDTNPAA